jgi:hypothetical protein
MPSHLPVDSQVHSAVLTTIAEHGAAPDTAELSVRLGLAIAEVDASLRRLADNHALVLHPGTTAVWIAHPFSLSPTAVWVEGRRLGHWAPCLWCALGIQTLVDDDVIIHTRLGGEGEDVRIAVPRRAAIASDLVAHFPMPPARAWDNVVHFCAMLLPFRAAADVDAWCARHRLPLGEVLPLGQLQQLARHWYAAHLAPDWIKWTPAQAVAIFREVGLDGPFWSLDAGGDRF